VGAARNILFVKMRLPLAGKIALVTGGGRGIGAAISIRLAEDGADVAVCDLDRTLAGTVAERAVASFGRRAIAVGMDVADEASVRGGVASVTERLGPVDVLVNNAGVDVIGPFIDSTEEAWGRIIAVNLVGTLRCCREVAPGMAERGSGTIVNIASDAGKVGSSGEAVYSATKGGIIAFSKTLARELAATGITVNCVCPGPTDTALLGQVAEANPRLRGALERAIPLRRVARPEEIANAVAFLAAPDASYITGQALSVSGGLTMV
jgi:2-hydroxycyclohexanecarboxyl-CoA dehydrogenase